MMKTLSLTCVIGIAKALVIKQCCGGNVTICCPDQEALPVQFDDAIEEDEDKVTEVIEDAKRYSNIEAKDDTSYIFEYYNADEDDSVTLEQLEAKLDTELSAGRCSLRYADLIRGYFGDAFVSAGHGENAISFDDLYDF